MEGAVLEATGGTCPALRRTEVKTLSQILGVLNAADDDLAEFDVDQLKDVASKLHVKVDSYRYMLKKIESRSKELAEDIKELQAAKKHLDNKAVNLKQLMLYHMQDKGFDTLPGEKYQVKLISKKALILSNLSVPDSVVYRKYPDLINRSFEWKKADLKNHIKTDPKSELAKYGEESTTSYIKFSVRKGVDENE